MAFQRFSNQGIPGITGQSGETPRIASSSIDAISPELGPTVNFDTIEPLDILPGAYLTLTGYDPRPTIVQTAVVIVTSISGTTIDADVVSTNIYSGVVDWDVVLSGKPGDAGPAGPTGPTGPAGATGPAGPNEITSATSTTFSGLIKGASGYAALAVAQTDYIAPFNYVNVDGTQTFTVSGNGTDPSAFLFRSDVSSNTAQISIEGTTGAILTGGTRTLGVSSAGYVVSDGSAFRTTIGAAAASHTHAASQISDSTTVGRNVLTLANPSAITFPRINADNTVTAQSASGVRSDLGLATTDSPTFRGLSLVGGSVATSTPVQTVTQTWDDGGSGTTTFTGVRFDFTRTSGSSGSNLLELRGGLSGTTTRFAVNDNGTATCTTLIAGSANLQSSFLQLNSSVILTTSAGDTIEQRRATNAQTHRLFNTYTSGGGTNASNNIVGEWLASEWISNTAWITTRAGTSGGSPRDLIIGRNGKRVIAIEELSGVSVVRLGYNNSIGSDGSSVLVIHRANQATAGFTISGDTGRVQGPGNGVTWEPYNYATADHTFIVGHNSAGNFFWRFGEDSSSSTTQTRAMMLTRTNLLGVGDITPTASFDTSGNTIRLRSSRTPASSTATGNQGDICWDANYLYICTATNTWRRISHGTW